MAGPRGRGRAPLSLLPLLLLLLLLLPATPQAVLKDYRSLQKNVSSLLDTLLDRTRYDKRIRPDFGGPPVNITVNMLIKSMGPVSETGEGCLPQEYVMDCYFRQTWQDRRLTYQFPGMDTFSLPWLFLDRVWKPDTFFMNGKKSHMHRITVPNKFLRLRHDGAITYSMRLTIKASCPMHLRKFPLDSQRCPLLIGSYGYLFTDVKYRWKEENAVVEEGVELAQYDLISIAVEQEQTITRGKDQYSVLKVSFLMKRHTGYFMLQVFAPCCLIVCCSWISFWIDPDAVPARVTLGVTTVLSMTTMGFGGRAQMPKVSYATALDWFVILCFSFVFAVLIEYAFINFIDKVTTDIKRILEERGIRKPAKPAAAAEGAAGAEPGAQPPAEPVVPLLVVDLAPPPGPDPEYPEYPEYAELEAKPQPPPPPPPPSPAPGEEAGGELAPLGPGLGRTPVVRSRPAGQQGGQPVVLASLVLEPPPPPPPPPADSPPDSPTQTQPALRRKDSLGINWGAVRQPLLRRKSLADLPAASGGAADVERGGGRRPSGASSRRPSLLSRRGSALLLPPPLDENADEDVFEDDEDEPQLDTLEALEVTIRGSVMELRERLGSVTVETGRTLREHLQRPLRLLRLLRDMRLLPNESDVTRLIMSDEQPPKFSRIDIAARRYFPLLFFLLFTLYWVLYIYYITDEFPAKEARVLNAQHRPPPPPL